MKKKAKIEKLNEIIKEAKPGSIEDIAVDGVVVKGENTGEYMILKNIIFQPNYKLLKKDGFTTEEKIHEVVKTTLERSLFEYCKAIGWWPKDNMNPYIITKETDGYLLRSHLIKDRTNPNAKSISEISDRIGVNQQ